MYIRNKWENGKYVTEEENDDDLIDEGKNPRQTYLYEYWHRGFPWFVPADRKKELNEKAIELESQGDIYKANDYYDSAKGELEGIHVAYYCDNILLEYRPYEFEHGEYPFSYTTRYFDDKNPYGFGEIRNVKIPQIMHNKADEIEIEAVSRQGLGGARYQVGSVSPKQMERILENAGKGGVWEEVTNLSGIQERSGVQVPQSIVNYKEHKQRMIETISSNTPIQQGMSPGSSVPFATIQELGARSDVRMRAISNKLEDFLVSVNRQRLELFAQFYTEERYYRIKGSDGKTKEGSLKSDDMKKQWVREQRQTPVMKTNELGEEVEDIEIQETIETFVPEYDVSVSVVSEKPTDRNYYTNLAMQLYNMQLLTPEHFLETLDKGKLPATKEILEGVYVKNPMMEITNMLQQVPPELQQAIQQEFQTIMQEAMQALQGQEQAQENPQNGNPFAK
jgi:hypothetical protein